MSSTNHTPRQQIRSKQSVYVMLSNSSGQKRKNIIFRILTCKYISRLYKSVWELHNMVIVESIFAKCKVRLCIRLILHGVVRIPWC